MNISDLRLPARQAKASAGPKRGSFDLPFFVLTLLLLTIGVIMVLSSSFARAYAQGKSPTYYFVRQAAFAVAGVVAMILLSKVRMVTYRRLSLLVLGVSIFLLAVVWIPHIGTRVNGARRWLSLGFTTFQPSEIAKIAVVLFFSSMICTYKEQMQTFRYGVVPFMVVTVIIVGLLMLEPHLSASIIIMALAIVMMFVGGIKLSYLLVGMGSAGALLLKQIRALCAQAHRVLARPVCRYERGWLSDRAVAVFHRLGRLSRARPRPEPAEVPLSARGA